ncbi:hypothetical protein [Desulfosarcina ovata]|uniref:B12-binding domain-containing protein n=1 Tax=Desulfosarcina ovata subsp. ovata TaxID=2752305 RepID=A0A5K8ADJ3_9BACT|nr:hypothetical protein [Desulfosarcina ovata]BBO90763.1 hypothetical protein DSCOOX_39430 [Desulfosarcina ovata subsp. ovata]
MQDARRQFREAVGRVARGWLTDGLPSRQGLDQAAEELDRLRHQLAVNGLWPHPPTMVTATLDDGLGQGLAIIEKYAALIGMQLFPLGLMQSPEAVIDACSRHQPDYLGMTILQYDTEDDLNRIARHLPAKTRIVAGGPVFNGDPDFSERTGVHYAAKNVAAFLTFMLAAEHG